MYVTADLQLHSRFSRAVSKAMTLPFIAQWARIKGIGLVATGDWTHPMWFREIQRDLEEVGNGLLRLKKHAEVAPFVIPSPALRGEESPPVGPLRLSEASEAGLSLSEKKSRIPACAGRRERSFASAQDDKASSPFFLLATEVSCIFSQGGKGRRIHILIWVPSFSSAEKINKQMTKQGCNLLSDGRPIIGLSAIQVAELVLSIEPKALVIPAHAWTPWFSLYGSMSGFDSIDEAFGPFAKNIYAVETGLSSNPSMNWRIKELDNRSIVSFSDAHSGPKLGREATVFEVPDGQLSYDAIYQAIKHSGAVEGSSFDSSRQGPDRLGVHQNSSAKAMTGLEKTRPDAHKLDNTQQRISNSRIAYTIEFYPEEGKYHYSGHRACNIRWGPEETKKNGNMCPVCGKKLVQGVEQRVEELAGRSEESLQLSAYSNQLSDETTIQMIKSKTFSNRPPFVMLVPLQEIIAEAIGSPVTSVKVQPIYEQLIDSFGSEFSVLMSASISDITKTAGERVAEGIDKVRKGDIVIEPGYDGVFGKVKIWREGEKSLVDTSKEQLAMFS